MASDGTTIEAAYDYSPWGEVTKIAGTGVESDFLYTGHFYHDKSELHLTLYRAYNPELGMWLSRDPIAENGGINLYAYVGNDPVNWWDPNGLCEVYSTGEAFGSKYGNHLYAHNPETGQNRGRNGSSGTWGGGGAPPDGPTPATHIHVGDIVYPDGVTNQDFMDELHRTAEDGIFRTTVLDDPLTSKAANDCHTSIERAAENIGAKFVPNSNYKGRIGTVNGGGRSHIGSTSSRNTGRRGERWSR